MSGHAPEAQGQQCFARSVGSVLQLARAIARRTSQLGTYVLDDFETGRHVLQDFRDVFAKMFQLPPQSGQASCFGRTFALLVASDRAMVAAQVVLPRCSPELILLPLLFLWFALLPVLPAAVPVARSGVPVSPTSGRTAGDAVSRSAAFKCSISTSREASCSRCEKT